MRTRLRIVLPGGNGQVGNILARHFHAQGDDVVVLARRATLAPWRVVNWDGATLGNWTSELENTDVLINLAGRSVDCRYTLANRRAIKESRTQTTRLLGQAIGHCLHPPRLWMNASTATIYRHALDRPMDEQMGRLVATNRMRLPNGVSVLMSPLAGRRLSSTLSHPILARSHFVAPWS